MENFICEVPHSIPTELCDEILNDTELLEKSVYNDTKNGKFSSIVLDNKKYAELIGVIETELVSALNVIKKRCNTVVYEYILLNKYEFAKFNKDIDYKVYSNSFSVIGELHSYFNFVFFLNDVEDGGELEIMGRVKIRPEKGKLLIFPSGWCFPYSHKVPFSNDKYIIYGELYTTHKIREP